MVPGRCGHRPDNCVLPQPTTKRVEIRKDPPFYRKPTASDPTLSRTHRATGSTNDGRSPFTKVRRRLRWVIEDVSHGSLEDQSQVTARDANRVFDSFDKRLEYLFEHRYKKRLFIGKVPVDRGAGYPDTSPDLVDTDSRKPAIGEQLSGRRHDRRLSIPRPNPR